MILYEYPFNERIRTYLRLEHLFRRLGRAGPARPPARPPLRARHHLRGDGRGRARRPEVRRDEGPGAAEAACSTATAATRPSPSRCSTRSSAKLEGCFTSAQQPARQGRPVADRERLADEHPQPRRHSGRHLRIRPARLLRLAAPATPATRRADLERWAAHAGAAGRVDPPAAQAAARLRRAAEGDGQPAASSSRPCRRAAPSSCCACASTPRWAWCPRSAATA